MASRKGINWMFVIIIAALAGTAATTLYRNQGLPSMQKGASPETSAAQLPEDRSSLELLNRLNELEKLSLADPQNVDYRTEIGNIYYDLGRYQNALDAYEQSLKLKPQNPSVATDAATCYHNVGQDDKALELLDEVLQFSPGFSQALFNKGVILIKGKGNLAAGIAVWEELLRTNPDFSQRAELEEQIRQYHASGR
jgi:cytochrome c-type biogenesis protein CcmH/NrfG